jgi:anti-sigma B factor antagonist
MMARFEFSSTIVSRRGSAPADQDAGFTVILLRGEHDIATRTSLVTAIARVAQRDEADVLIDMSAVTFMDASTIGALVGSRNRLRLRSQSLAVRAPSPAALRALELCGLTQLLHRSATVALHPTGVAAALSTWVDVPSARPDRELNRDGDETPRPAERQVARAIQRMANARSSRADAIVETDRGGS